MKKKSTGTKDKVAKTHRTAKPVAPTPIFLNPAYREAYENVVAEEARLSKAPIEEQIAFIRSIGGGEYLDKYGIR